eukprot:6202995-Pleurochrysis_carterae.AAC.2
MRETISCNLRDKRRCCRLEPALRLAVVLMLAPPAHLVNREQQLRLPLGGRLQRLVSVRA